MDVDDEDLAALGRKLVDDVQRLVRAELDLIRAELTAAMKRVAVAIGLLAAAGMFLLVAFIEAMGALPSWLGPAVFSSTWIGWLLVGGALLIVAVGLGLLGTMRVRRSLRLGKHTFDTIKEDGQWLRGLIRRGDSGS